MVHNLMSIRDEETVQDLEEKAPKSLFELAKQFLKFGIVGISNTAIYLAVYYLLLSIGVNYLIANCVGFVVSVINAYFWNNKYVFSQSSSKPTQTFIKVFVSYGSTFLLSTGLLYVLVQLLGVSDVIAPLLILVITVPLNFLLNKFWAFK